MLSVFRYVLILLILVLQCATARAQSSDAQVKSLVSEAVAPSHYQLYRVADLDKPGAPVLSAIELNWIKRIEHTPYYKNRIETLWFTPEASKTKRGPPLLVFDGGSASRAVVEGRSSFWIIGDGCNMFLIKGLGEMPALDIEDPDCKSGKAQVKYR